MTEHKEYWFFRCRHCDIDFLLGNTTVKRVCCPVCTESLYIERVTSVWMDRPFRYRKRWTQEEDDIILDGKRLGYTEKRITESLPDRTYKAIRKRWYTLQKKKREAVGYGN